MKEVFEIYRKWIQKSVKSKFQSFTLPLYGSKYEWYGIDKERFGSILSDSFRMSGLKKLVLSLVYAKIKDKKMGFKMKAIEEMQPPALNNLIRENHFLLSD